MKFYSSAVFDGSSGGTCLQGRVQVSYDRLVEVFGEPLDGDGDKTRAEWIVHFEDGTLATIYDWKHYDTPVYSVTDWNVGGRGSRSVALVDAALAGREVEDE